jgi:hypothetical protein
MDVPVGRTYLPGESWGDLEGPDWALDPWSAWRTARPERMLVLNVPMVAPNEPPASDDVAAVQPAQPVRADHGKTGWLVVRLRPQRTELQQLERPPVDADPDLPEQHRRPDLPPHGHRDCQHYRADQDQRDGGADDVQDSLAVRRPAQAHHR